MLLALYCCAAMIAPLANERDRGLPGFSEVTLTSSISSQTKSALILSSNVTLLLILWIMMLICSLLR